MNASWAGTATRGPNLPGYRNAYHPARELTVGLGPVAVRVAQVPREVAPQGYHSGSAALPAGVPDHPAACLPASIWKGWPRGDFEPVFRELVGETTALSANTVVRLKEHWGGEYEAWRQRPLGNTAMPTSGRWCLPVGGGRAREDGALVCPWGPGRWGEGTAGDGAGLPGEHRELGRRDAGPAGPGTGSAPAGGG